MRSASGWPALLLCLAACSGDRFELVSAPAAGGSAGAASGGTAGAAGATAGAGGASGMAGASGTGGSAPECLALRFDGDDDFVRVPDAPALDGIAPMTVEAWIKPEEYPSEVQIVSHHDHDAHTGYVLLVYQSGHMQFRYQFDAQNHNVGYAPVSAGAWHHVAATYDAGTARLFVDGVEKNEANIGSGVAADFAGPLVIGRAAYTKGFHFKGYIDEVRLSKTARYAVDFVPQHAFEPDADTVAYFNFEETGQQVSDTTGQHHGWLGLDGVESADDPTREAVPCTH